MLDSKLIENLIKALQYEQRTYERLLNIAEQKTDCLIKDDTALLVSITEEEKKMADQTRQLNQVREQLLSKICSDLGQDFKTFTINKLKELTSEPFKKQLEDIQQKLSETVNKLYARNGINDKLIENALKYINFNIQLIAAPQPAAPSYGRSGQEVNTTVKRSMLDVKF
ncbi:MAG: flagellar protein FlgN [Clostridia bacterium]|nr:flagellar protein FlgN [Clostridia bacterium]